MPVCTGIGLGAARKTGFDARDDNAHSSLLPIGSNRYCHLRGSGEKKSPDRAACRDHAKESSGRKVKFSKR
jgi:hypothetical protein